SDLRRRPRRRRPADRSLLHFELRIDHVILALAVAAGRFAAARLWAALLEVLGHGVRSGVQGADGLLDGRHVRAAGRVLAGLDGRSYWRLVAARDLVRVVAQRFLDLVDDGVGPIPNVDQLTAAAVLLGM